MLWPTQLKGIPIRKSHNREAVINLSRETLQVKVMEKSPEPAPGNDKLILVSIFTVFDCGKDT